MRLRGVVLAALVVVGLVCFPTGVNAEVHHYLLRPGGYLRIELESSNGYWIRITSNRRRHLTLRTMKEGIVTEYEVQGDRVGPDRVRAKLPGLGLVSVHFRQRGPAHHLPAYANCDGSSRVLRRGVVHGTIKFVGERRYTHHVTHRAHAEIEEWAQQRCRASSPPRHSQPAWIGSFEASASANNPTVYFSAIKYPPHVIKGGQVAFTADLFFARRTLRVWRHATVVAPASTFEIPEPSTYPEHVILTPPAPFTGSGTFSRTPESVFSWEGDLAIQFPGIDSLSLTGANFETSYCARRSCVHQDAEPEPGTS